MPLAPLSPDGRTALALASDGALTLYPMGGDGEPRPLPGATRQDVPIRWSADGQSCVYSNRRVLDDLMLATRLL
jgi:hypothetical protein